MSKNDIGKMAIAIFMLVLSLIALGIIIGIIFDFEWVYGGKIEIYGMSILLIFASLTALGIALNKRWAISTILAFTVIFTALSVWWQIGMLTPSWGGFSIYIFIWLVMLLSSSWHLHKQLGSK